MTVLVLGARGFIGAHVASALEAAGCRVERAARPAVDFARDFSPQVWATRLDGIDTVVNAVGILREKGEQTFDAVHFRAPIGLFEACAGKGIRVIQISALGADEGAETRFHRSKKAADDALLAMPVDSIVLQPSLVFGRESGSARMFAMLATLPVIPVPAGGGQRIQPVHVDDVAAAVVQVVKRGWFVRSRVALVGPEPLTFREFLAALRSSLGFERARFVSIPRPLVETSAALGIGWLDRDNWSMLERGNVADASAARELLGRSPRSTGEFIPRTEREAMSTDAKLGWVLPLLRVSLAIMWIAAGVVSMGVYPVAESLAMLERVHLAGPMAHAALYGAAAFDLAMGVAMLVLRRRTWLYVVQMAMILAYTAIITIFMPEQWLHPFGPVVKNLPVLAAIYLLHQLEKR